MNILANKKSHSEYPVTNTQWKIIDYSLNGYLESLNLKGYNNGHRWGIFEGINLGMKFQVLRGNIASRTTFQNQAFPCGIRAKKIMHESKYSQSEYFYILWWSPKVLQEKN